MILQGTRRGDNASGPTTRPYERLERLGRACWWALGIALLVILGYVLLARYSTVIIPSLIGIVLATTLSPVVGRLVRWRVPRLAAAALISLVGVAGLVLLSWGLVALLIDRGPQLWGMLGSGATQAGHWLGRFAAASSTIERLRAQMSALLSEMLPLTLKGVRRLYDLVVAVFLAASFSFFFLWQGPQVRRWVARHLTVPEDVGLEITGSLVRTTRRYVAGLSGIGACQAVIVGGTAAAVGVSTWPEIALVIFLGNYIPYVGGLIAGIFAVLLTLGTRGPGPTLAVLIAIVIAYVAGSHLGVFFIGSAIRLPVTAVFVLTVGGAAVAGVFGAAVAAPLARLVIDAQAIIRAHVEGHIAPDADVAAPPPT